MTSNDSTLNYDYYRLVFVDSPNSFEVLALFWSEYKHRCTKIYLVAITPNCFLYVIVEDSVISLSRMTVGLNQIRVTSQYHQVLPRECKWHTMMSWQRIVSEMFVFLSRKRSPNKIVPDFIAWGAAPWIAYLWWYCNYMLCVCFDILDNVNYT